MSLDFHEYKLGELCNISSSKRIFAREYVDEGIPFYRGKEIIELFNNRDVSNELFITRDKYESIKGKYGVPEEGDILLSSVGTLGIPYLVKNEKFYFKDGNLTWFKDFDSKLNNKFLYWWFQSIEAKYQINNKCIGSTQKALPITTLEKFEISVPSIKTQIQIVDILESISNKIKTNISINKNLTSSLSLLFKNWFVDFNFLNEDNKPYKTNNGQMKNSELGLIPNDWNIGILGDYLRIERGLSYKGKYLSDEGIPLINLGNILPNSKFRLEKLKFYSGDYDEKYIVNVGDILVANTDLTQDRLVLGSPIIVPSLIDNETIIYSHHINRLSNFKLPKFYIFYNLLSERYNHMVSGYATGTTVLAISKESIYNYQIIIPPKELLLQFEEIAENIEKIKENNILEIEKLTKLRDTLLPKLMSGEIDVSQINCDLE